jgi:hypothetical protein
MIRWQCVGSGGTAGVASQMPVVVPRGQLHVIQAALMTEVQLEGSAVLCHWPAGCRLAHPLVLLTPGCELALLQPVCHMAAHMC